MEETVIRLSDLYTTEDLEHMASIVQRQGIMVRLLHNKVKELQAIIDSPIIKEE